jgi:hypothetical protein
MAHLSEFMNSFDFVHSQPSTDWIASYPEHLNVSGLSASGRDYIAYLGDARELSDPDAGKAITGGLTLALPPGSYSVSLYSPATGEHSPEVRVEGGIKSTLTLLPFRQDIVIRAKMLKE